MANQPLLLELGAPCFAGPRSKRTLGGRNVENSTRDREVFAVFFLFLLHFS